MRITMTRGDLFQISQSVQRLAPAKPAHAERFRRTAESLINRAKRIDKDHKAECQADVDALPKEDQTQQKIAEIRKDRAATSVEIDLDPRDLQVLAAGYINFWTLPANDKTSLGMPYDALQPLAEDLKVFGVWDPWKLGEKLVIDDPSLDELLPLSLIETVPLDDELPLGALPGADAGLEGSSSQEA